MYQYTDIRSQKLFGLIVCASLLTACGSGSNNIDSTTEKPNLGQANSTSSSNSSQDSLPITIPNSGEEAESEAPPSVSCTSGSNQLQASALYLINQARAVARMCGNQHFSAAPPLAWNSVLQATAQQHSQDMAQYNFFSHTGSNGSSAAQRANNLGYNWQTIGENIAAGQKSTTNAIQGWLNSPGHCANIMNPSFKDTAVACVENNQSQFKQYWTNALGSAQ